LASTLIADTTVVTVNQTDDILSPADVLVEDGRISYVGPPRPSLRSQSFDDVIDGRDRVVMPGLVNGHTHTYATFFKGSFERMPLDLWLQLMRSPSQRLNEEQLYLSSLVSGVEMLRTGTTTLLDLYFGNPAMELAGMAHQVQALRDVGIRAAVALIIADIKWEDTLPMQSDALAAAGEEVRRVGERETAKSLDAAEASVERFHRAHPRLTCLVGPSAAHRCSDALLQACRDLAERRKTGIHLHCGEGKTHALQCVQRFGETLVGRLDRLGALGPNVSLAHGVWLSDPELEALGRTGATVVHDPGSNLKLGDGVARLRAMWEHDVHVAVATDGPCSSDHFNMFEAMRLAAILHTSNQVDYRRWPSARQALRMATIEAARACNLEDEIGSIEAGKRADLLVLTRNSYHLAADNDLVRQLVYCENGTSIELVMVDGQIVVRDGKLLTVDEQDVFRQVRRARAALQPVVAEDYQRAWTLEQPLREMYFRTMDAPFGNVRPGVRFE
jgi:5-methylthioadenosine/S-adenosylhomocysteine deaminase